MSVPASCPPACAVTMVAAASPLGVRGCPEELPAALRRTAATLAGTSTTTALPLATVTS